MEKQEDPGKRQLRIPGEERAPGLSGWAYDITRLRVQSADTGSPIRKRRLPRSILRGDRLGVNPKQDLEGSWG